MEIELGIIIGMLFYISLNARDILNTNEMILEYIEKIYKIKREESDYEN